MNILIYKSYRGSFEYDPKTNVFHGDVLDITDVITFQGRSIDELKNSLADSIEDYLEFCEERNKLPDQSY